MLNKQIDQLPETVQEVLKVASVAGMQFTTAMVASGAEAETGLIDDALTWAASKSYFLQAQGIESWPDSTVSGAYQFGHALYRQVLYDRLSAEQCVKWHRLMAERLERAYIDDVEPVVGLLAYHFVQGRDVPRALQYLHRASLKALGRYAANESIAHLNAALELLPALPSEQNRVQMEYDLQVTLGKAIISRRGVRVPEALAAYERAYQLGVAIGDVEQLFPTLVGLENIACIQAKFQQSQHLGGQLLNYAQMTGNPLHLAHAYGALSLNHSMQGHILVANHYAQVCQRLPTTCGAIPLTPSTRFSFVSAGMP
ncbi:hypothetical protein [Candidatus Entotheonella palauensis]|uniref:hypothetical protein n=1 Tax=Candidatus Entotheonella palauensis TaxID=93172 RepID=UPI0015C4E437|nr:hypothetical protein [Candidatus Entotheonella palauensis]